MNKRIHQPQKKGRHFFEYLIINIFVFAGIWLLSLFVFNVSLFNQFTQAFKDFTITDIVYSRKIIAQDSIYKKQPLLLINIEDKSREEIAFLLQRIEEGKPKVVALDIIFADKKDSASDELLKQTLNNYNNIITPYIASFDGVTAESKSNEYFKINSGAYVNLLGENKEYSTIRYYYPVYNKVPAFTTAIIQKFDPSKANALLKRNNTKTEIRYYGDLQNFDYKNFSEVMNPAFDADALKDKIVLLGYMGVENKSLSKLDEDRFFTPLNQRISGRSLPDMYGVVVIANILRMELDNDFMYAFPQWLNWLVAFLLSWILLPMFVRWYVHKAVWFHLFTMLLQLCITMVFVFLTIWLYANANIKIESSAVLVSVLLIGDFLLFYDHLVKFFKYKLKWNFNSVFFGHEH